MTIPPDNRNHQVVYTISLLQNPQYRTDTKGDTDLPNGNFVSWSIDFIGLTLYDGHYAMFTCIDWLIKYCRLIPCFLSEGALSASLVAKLFFDNVVRFFGILGEVISDRGPRFIASFW